MCNLHQNVTHTLDEGYACHIDATIELFTDKYVSCVYRRGNINYGNSLTFIPIICTPQDEYVIPNFGN